MGYSSSDLFILRRAWRIGKVTRADVARAFGTERSPATTARLMEAAVRAWPAHIYWRKKRGILPMHGAQCPPEASASRVLDLLARGAPARETGIFEDDGVLMLRHEPLSSNGMTESATGHVLDAVLKDEPVEILYVGLRRGESARWRRIWPSAIEHTGLYWRILAQDLDAKDFRIKTFVLSRVLDAKPMRSDNIPKGFRRLTTVRQNLRLRVHFNEALTSDQQVVLRHGFGIGHDGIMSWPEHSLYDLKRVWSDAPPQEGIVWPIFTRIDKVT